MGRFHETITFLPDNVNVGGSILAGTDTIDVVSIGEYGPNPYMFCALILKLYYFELDNVPVKLYVVDKSFETIPVKGVHEDVP